MSNQNQNKKTKLSLNNIWKSHLNKVDSSNKSFAEEYGFILILSLSGAEKKASLLGADTYVVNGGYCTLPLAKKENSITVPFMVSWNGYGLQPDQTGKINLVQYDNAGRMDSDLEGVPINWSLTLDNALLRKLLGTDTKESKAWKEFVSLITEKQKAQIQMLVVLAADPTKGRGKLEVVSRLGENKQAYKLALQKQDIYTIRLVTPGPEFLDKVDKPATVMGRLEGKVVDEQTKVVSCFQGLKQQFSQKKAEQEAFNSSEAKKAVAENKNETESSDEQEEDNSRLGM